MVTPPNGSIETRFLLEALDFTDDPEDFPLRFLFMAETDQSRLILNPSEPQLSSLPGVILPYDGIANITLGIFVRVLDVYNAITESWTSVRLEPTTSSVSDILSNLFNEEAAVSSDAQMQRLALGSNVIATQLKQINESTSTDAESEEIEQLQLVSIGSSQLNV